MSVGLFSLWMRRFVLSGLMGLALLTAQGWSGTFQVGTVDGRFEAGLPGVLTQGDARLVSGLGPLRPTGGGQALILTTTPDAGATPAEATESWVQIPQITLPTGLTQLRLDYNVLTHEPVPSLANDQFVVRLAVIGTGGAATVLQVDTFETFYPAPFTGYAHQTGFRTLVADLSAHAGSGEPLTLEFRLMDAADGRYDSAVLLDQLQLTHSDEPQARANVDYLTLNPGETFVFDALDSRDPNQDIVDYLWDFDNGVTRSGPIIEYAYPEAGLYQAMLTVTDQAGHSHTDILIVGVGAFNQAPRITSVAQTLAMEDHLYRYPVVAEDADLGIGDTLRFALRQAPSGMQMDPVSGVITWTPTAASPRHHPVTLEVTDSLGLSATQDFRIVVTVADETIACDSYPVAPALIGLAFSPDASELYVASRVSSASNLITLDAHRATPLSLLSLDPGFPIGSAITRDGARMYLAVSRFAGTQIAGQNRVEVIDTASRTRLTSIPIGGIGASDVAVSPDDRWAYVTDRFGNRVDIIDLKTHTLSGSVSVGGVPMGVAVTPDGRRVYAVGRGGVTVAVIDTASRTVVATLDAGLARSNNGTDIAMATDGTRAYVTSTSDSRVAVIDTDPASPTLHESLAIIPTTGGALAGLAASPDGRRVYVVSSQAHQVIIIDTAPDSPTLYQQIGAAPVGAGPHDVVFGNVPPEITSSPPLTATAGELYTYQVETIAVEPLVYVASFTAGSISACALVTDSEEEAFGLGEGLVFALLEAPPGMDIDSVTGRITWTPTVVSPAQHLVTLQVTDRLGLRATQSYQIVAAVSSRPPVAVAGGPYTAEEGRPLILDASASSDPDGNPLTYAWDLDGDGVFDDSGLVRPPLLFPDDGTFSVALQLSDGTETSLDTTSVTVTNVDPVVDAGPDLSASEGEPVAFAATLSDPGADTHTISWDFGDGTGVTDTLTPTHPYEQDGVYTVTVTVTDDDGGTGTDTLTVTVTNVSPTVAPIADQTIADGGAFVVSATVTDPGQDTQTVVIDWGDDSPAETQILPPEAGGNISATHRYADDGVFTVTVTVTDESGGSDTQSVTVTVENVAPVVNAGPDQSAPEGSTLSFGGSFTDLGADTHTIGWDFGDGTLVTGTLTPTHLYAQDGVYSVTVTVTDDDGAVGSDTLMVTVTNVTPVVDAGGDQTVTEGGLVGFDGRFGDPGADTHTVAWDFGDGTTATDSLTPTHVYPQDGVYTVALQVTDQDGGVGLDTLAVEVRNTAPSVQAGADQTVEEDQPIEVSASFTDAGVLDTHDVQIDWGDGVIETVLVLATTDPHVIEASHVYTEVGVYPATIQVTDDADAVGTGTVIVTVTPANRAPVANAGPDQTLDEGVLATLDGSASQDADGDPLTYQWTQVAGPESTLDLTDDRHPTFVIPSVSAEGAILTFTLVVSDGSINSDPAVVNMTVKNINHAPHADAGEPQTVREGSQVTLDGSGSFDPDNEPLTYVWNQTGGPAAQLTQATATNPTLTAPPVDAAGAVLRFVLTVSDGIDSGSAETTINVSNVNQAPMADAGAPQTAHENRPVQLNGSASSDPDGDPLTYAWTQLSGPSVSLDDATVSKPTFTTPLTPPGGVTLVFGLIVSDGNVNSPQAQVPITVLNINDPPACDLAQADVARLWPPNHKLVPVAVVNVTDADNDVIHITLTDITQDEPVNGHGDGDTSPDAVLQAGQILLRSERSGGGSGRVYAIHFQASDGFHPACTGQVTVCVPHTKKGSCVDEGQHYDARQP